MDKYLKMADIFIVGAVTSEHVISLCDDCLAGHWSSEIPNQYAAHAINSHDKLVEEVERLRRNLACAFMAGWEEGINGMECDEAEVASVEIAEQFARN